MTVQSAAASQSPPAAGGSAPRLRTKSLLVIVLLAALHAVSMVIVRPMFQVSDEVAYFSGVQVGALERASGDGTLRRLVAPPDGRPLERDAAGKPLFKAAVGRLYGVLVTHASPATAVVLLRLVLGVSLVVAVVFTALMARVVAPSNTLVELGAPLLVALQPVFATYCAAITPDSLANACAAVTMWLLVRFASGIGHAAEPLALAAAAATAFLFKDTSLFLAAGLLFGLVGRALTMHERLGSWTAAWRQDRWLALGGVLVAASPLLLVFGRVRALLFDSQNFRELAEALDRGSVGAPVSGLDLVITNLQPVTVFSSFWANLANFGGNEVLLPDELVATIAAACLLGVVGLAWSLVSPPALEPLDDARLTRRLALLLLACAFVIIMQAPARRVLLAESGALQGRWIFPMIGPLMILLCLGWSRLLRGRPNALPLIGFACATVAATALVGVLIPTFYLSFPDLYRFDSLFLRGPFGRPVETSRVMVFVGRPDWLRSPMAVLPVVAFVGAAFAWPLWQFRTLRQAATLRRAGRSSPRRREAAGPP